MYCLNFQLTLCKCFGGHASSIVSRGTGHRKRSVLGAMWLQKLCAGSYDRTSSMWFSSSIIPLCCFFIYGFWIDCVICIIDRVTFTFAPRLKQRIDFNMYSPNASSTSEIVRCNGTLCGKRRQCLVESNACGYSVAYLSQNTSSQGVLVEDVLHLVTEDSQQKSIDAPITLGYTWVLIFCSCITT